MPWHCHICSTSNLDAENKCAACEEPREGLKVQTSGSGKIIFGAGPAQTPGFGSTNSFTVPILASQSGTPITFGSHGLSTEASGARLSFAPVSATPLSTGFCTAMATPPRSSVTLIGAVPEELGDKGCPQPEGMGKVYTWGSGECEQLAVHPSNLDSSNCRPTPIVIKKLNSPIVEDIAAGSLTSYAITNSGDVLSWGCSDNGALGRPIKGQAATLKGFPECHMDLIHGAKVPTTIPNIPKRVVKVCAGDSHGVALTDEGDVYAWGGYRDNSGPLGYYNSQTKEFIECSFGPVKVEISGIVLEIASGDNHTIALVELSGDGGRALCAWGSSEYGQCLQPPPPDGAEPTVRREHLIPKIYTVNELNLSLGTYPSSSIPSDLCAELRTDGKLLHVYCGKNNTFLLIGARDGNTYIFGLGRNTYGQVGAGFVSSSIVSPTLVNVPHLTKFLDLQGGDDYTVALSADGTVWTWGHSEFLGQGKQSDKYVLNPRPVPGLRNRVASVGAASNTCYATTFSGRLVAWGDNQQYQLGTGEESLDPVVTPSVVCETAFGTNSFVKKVRGGSQHAIAMILEAPVHIGTKRRMPPITLEEETTPVLKRARVEGFFQINAQTATIVPPIPTIEDSLPINEEENIPTFREAASREQSPDAMGESLEDNQSEDKSDEKIEPKDNFDSVELHQEAEVEVHPDPSNVMKENISDEPESNAMPDEEPPSEEEAVPTEKSEDEGSPVEEVKTKGKGKSKAKARAKTKAKAKAKAKAKSKAKEPEGEDEQNDNDEVGETKAPSKPARTLRTRAPKTEEPVPSEPAQPPAVTAKVKGGRKKATIQSSSQGEESTSTVVEPPEAPTKRSKKGTVQKEENDEDSMKTVKKLGKKKKPADDEPQDSSNTAAPQTKAKAKRGAKAKTDDAPPGDVAKPKRGASSKRKAAA